MPEPLSKDANAFSAGAGSGATGVHAAGRGRAAEGRAALLEVADLGGVGAGVAVGHHAVDELRCRRSGSSSRSRMFLNSSTVSFFIWWLAFFDAKPSPRV